VSLRASLASVAASPARRWGLAALALALAGCAGTDRTELWIPLEAPGYETSGMTIYGRAREGVPSAIGQVFELPAAPADLRRVGFMVIYPKDDIRTTLAGVTTASVRLRLLVSEWDGGKPRGQPVWQSAAVELAKAPRDDRPSRIDWLWFDVAPLRLRPGQKYLAWLTMAGLSNAAADSISVVRMGPRASIERPKLHSRYPEGAMAIWSGTNPDDGLAAMGGSAWAIERADVNLHFRMLFVPVTSGSPGRAATM
jgi:hypothetical protein